MQFDISSEQARQLAEKFHKLQKVADKNQWESGDILADLRKQGAQFSEMRELLGFRYSKGYLSKLQSVASVFSGDKRKEAISSGATYHDCYEAYRLANRDRGRFPKPPAPNVLALILEAKADPKIDDPIQHVADGIRDKADEHNRQTAKAIPSKPISEDVFEAGDPKEEQYPNPNGAVTGRGLARDWGFAQRRMEKTAKDFRAGGFAFCVALDKDRGKVHAYGYFRGTDADRTAVASALLAQLQRMMPAVRNLGGSKLEPEAQSIFQKFAAEL